MDYAELIKIYNEKKNNINELIKSLNEKYDESHYLVNLANNIIVIYDEYDKLSSLVENKEEYFTLLTKAIDLGIEILNIKGPDSYPKMSIFKKKKLIKENNQNKDLRIKEIYEVLQKLDQMIGGEASAL